MALFHSFSFSQLFHRYTSSSSIRLSTNTKVACSYRLLWVTLLWTNGCILFLNYSFLWIYVLEWDHCIPVTAKCQVPSITKNWNVGCYIYVWIYINIYYLDTYGTYRIYMLICDTWKFSILDTIVSILNVIDVIMVLQLLGRRSLFLGDVQQSLWVFTLSRSVMSDSLQPHGLQPARLFCPWDSPSKNTGVDCHFLLQGNLPTPGIKPMSPVSLVPAVGFLTTGKSHQKCLSVKCHCL